MINKDYEIHSLIEWECFDLYIIQSPPNELMFTKGLWGYNLVSAH